jgi:hypothetical protein
MIKRSKMAGMSDWEEVLAARFMMIKTKDKKWRDKYACSHVSGWQVKPQGETPDVAFS